MKVSIKLAALFFGIWSSFTYAGWEQGTYGGKSTWVYVPSTAPTLAGKRALMLNLHGCGQANTVLKDNGNWPAQAERTGMIVAVPSAGSFCWDYGSATTSNAHVQALVKAVSDLTAKYSNNAYPIDANQVYISGLSSGASMALLAACVAPDVFAGVGSIAGPSVGSSQAGALGNVPAGNVNNAISKCNSLAGAKKSHFTTQIYSIGYGDGDKGGVFTGRGTALVDVNWNLDNIKIYQSVLGVGSLGQGVRQSNSGRDEATISSVAANGKEVLSLAVIHGTKHAWPSGDGSATANWNDGGSYAYPEYLTNWLFANNRRAQNSTENQAPTVTVAASVSGNTVFVTGAVQDDGAIAQVSLQLLNQTSGQSTNADANVAGDSYATSLNDLAAGTYLVQATVTDAGGLTASATTSFQVLETSNTAPVIQLTGGATLNVQQGQAFVDPGAIAVDAEDGNLTANIITQCNVNTAVAGTYSCNYCVTDSFGAESCVARSVIVEAVVVENQLPVISVLGANPLVVLQGDSFVDPGATANDAEDGNISALVQSSCNVNTAAAGNYSCVYSVTDSAGATAVASRVVRVEAKPAENDVTPPVIQILGANPLTIVVGSMFNDPGVKATDNVDGDLTSQVATVCDVNAAVVGSYQCQYAVSDSSGNLSSKVRTVVVQAKPDEGDQCKQYTAFLLNHRMAKRIYSEGWFGTEAYYAVGSDEQLTGSWWGLHTLHHFNGEAVYHVGPCP